jgi:hypothetical protein
VILSEKKLISIYQSTQEERQAWTDGVNLYIYSRETGNPIHYGIFTTDASFRKPDVTNHIYTKTATEVSIAPEFRGTIHQRIEKHKPGNG